MRKQCKSALLFAVVCCSGWNVMAVEKPKDNSQKSDSEKRISDVTTEEDPFLWLEDVTAEKSLNWVREQNKKSIATIAETDKFKKLESDLLQILDSDDRIPGVSKIGDYYYNFWRDKDNPRGLWRRTSLDEYRKDEPEWDVILDLDRTAEEENENWVWSGASVLRPSYDRVLIDLSRGGADATVTREFDLETREFVENGFQREEAKGGMDWIDRDRVFVFTDFGEGSSTDSGYPRIVKLLERGQNIEDAKTIYEGQGDDMYIAAIHDNTPGFERNFVSRTLAFYNDELYLLSDDLELTKIDAPNSANKNVIRDYLVLELREPWEVGGKSFTAGSLLVADFDQYMSGGREFDVAFEPSDNTSLASFGYTKNHLYINVLEDVKNRIYVLTDTEKGWQREPLVGAPKIGTVSIRAVDADQNDDFFMTSTDYLTPTTLHYGTIGEQPETLKTTPAFFDSEGLKIEQHFATSDDGTKVPYFMVSKEDLNMDGENPTLLYGYGGFEISLTPGYNASAGRAWLNEGGVYVVANIRGGGEYGPRWHQAALKANRLLAYADFAAVAKDLKSRGVTSTEHLGIQGGSNGGLLVGNMVTLYPDLFKAAVCQVPLLDMKRYHRLLAGASWMAEYGDPDDAQQWEFIQSYSPYQNVTASTEYPTVLFTTSTRDDRVHPGHARKMMARMMEQGHDVLYYENIEGGHGGAANNKQRAFMQAIAYTFLMQQLSHE